MKIILSIFLVIISLSILGCEVETTTEKMYPLTFSNSSTLDKMRNNLGADSITGYLSTFMYSDSVEHTMMTITIHNPQNSNDLILPRFS